MFTFFFAVLVLMLASKVGGGAGWSFQAVALNQIVKLVENSQIGTCRDCLQSHEGSSRKSSV